MDLTPCGLVYKPALLSNWFVKLYFSLVSSDLTIYTFMWDQIGITYPNTSIFLHFSQPFQDFLAKLNYYSCSNINIYYYVHRYSLDGKTRWWIFWNFIFRQIDAMMYLENMFFQRM